MRLTRPLPLLCALSFAVSFAATAQQTPACPTLPSDAADLHWVTLRTDSALLCRALRRDSGEEAFAVTLSRKSPFRPTNGLREEQGQIRGERFWWYRSEIVGRPNELVRETLLELGRHQVAHIFIRTSDRTALNRYQGIAQHLEFDAQELANR